MKWISIILILSLFGCKKDLPDRQTLLDAYYQKKESEFLNGRSEDCKKKAIAEAQVAIDSLLDNWLNANLFDTLSFPQKPIKPVTPNHIIDKVSKFEIEDENN